MKKDICLSASSYHPELWQPEWKLHDLVIALRSYMLSSPREIGGVHSTDEEKRILAKNSRSFVCSICSLDHGALCGDKSADCSPITLRETAFIRSSGKRSSFELSLNPFGRKVLRRSSSDNGRRLLRFTWNVLSFVSFVTFVVLFLS